MLRIRRSKPISGFTILPNDTLRDDRLSYAARGVLAELLSRPDKWETNADALSERARRNRDIVGEGRRGMRSAFAELESAGYMIRRREKSANGRYSTVLEVYDLPQHRGTARGTSAGGTSVSGTSATGTSTRSTDYGSTEYEDGGDEHSTALASTRAAHASERAKESLGSEIDGWYAAADKLSDDRLRRHLLAFERRRPKIYRLCRQNALTQIGNDKGGTALLNSKDGVRAIDLLAFKYALQHYVDSMPGWLTKLPA